jgi:hypothetical protein
LVFGPAARGRSVVPSFLDFLPFTAPLVDVCGLVMSTHRHATIFPLTKVCCVFIARLPAEAVGHSWQWCRNTRHENRNAIKPAAV